MQKTDKFNNYLNKMNNMEDLKIRSIPIKYNFHFLKQLKHNLQVILVQKLRLNLQVFLVWPIFKQKFQLNFYLSM